MINIIRCDVYLPSTNNLFPIRLIRLISLISPIGLIACSFVIIFHIIILNTCSFLIDLLKVLFKTLTNALLKSN